MQIPENVKTLINNYYRFLSSSTEKEEDAAEALKSISVVRRTDDAVYHLVGIATGLQSEELTLNFRSCSPTVKKYSEIGGCVMEYDYCAISESEFDDMFYTYDAWQDGIYKITVAEMNKEIFKFLHPYFISSKQDWTFEISCMGAVMSIKFWGYGAYKYEKLVIHVVRMNRATIKLYIDPESATVSEYKDTVVFDYEDTAVTMDPVRYGPLTEEIMLKLCEKVEEIMRRNLR